MPRGVRRTQCVVCRELVSEVGELSARGKCARCAETRAIENAAQLHAHGGPYFDHWRRRTLAAFGVVEVETDRRAE